MKLSVLYLTFITMIYLSQVSTYSMASGVGIMPNASEVYAMVKEKRIINATGYVTLHVVEAKNYKSMPNFVSDQIGKDITVIVSKDDIPYFYKENVNVLISVIGDEKHQEYTARLKP